MTDYMSQLPDKPGMVEQTKARKKEYALKKRAEKVEQQKQRERETTAKAHDNLQEVLAKMKKNP